MTQTIEELRARKQEYIVGNIDPNHYEDFHEFCTSYAGAIDIDAWSIDYVQELVAKFKDFMKNNQQQQSPHEKSFAIYQTTTVAQVMQEEAKMATKTMLNELEEPARSPPPSMKKKDNKSQQPIKPVQETVSPKPFAKKTVETKNSNNKQSAVDLLDSVFEVKEQDKQKMDEINKSFFNSSSFWDVPKIEQKTTPKQDNKTSSPGVMSPKTQFTSGKFGTNQSQANKNAVKTPETAKPKDQKLDQLNQSKAIDQYFNMMYNPKAGTSISTNTTAHNLNNNKNLGNTSIDIRSQFDTFSQMADEQLQKKKTNNTASTLNVFEDPQQTRMKSNSTIKLKEVKELKPGSSSISHNSEIVSNQSKITHKQSGGKGSRIIMRDFVDQVQCVKSSSRANLANSDISVEIAKFDIIQRSIFSSNYLMYHMKVNPLAITCKRNYQDFTKLRQTLQKFYPGVQLPYLQKDSWRADTSEEYARRQAKMLQYFIADILRNPELRNSRITQQFLSIQDHKKMKRKFEEYGKMEQLKSIQQLCLLSGKVEVALTSTQQSYNEQMGKLVQKYESNIEKYRKQCEHLSGYYNQIMQTSLTIDEILKEMQRDASDFNKFVTIREIDSLQGSLKKVRDNYKECYFRAKFQNKIIEQNVIPFLRYEKENTHVSKQILQICNSLTHKYIKRSQSEQNSVHSQSYLSESHNPYKQGITEQSKDIVVLKYQAGYMQMQASTQLQRIMQNLGVKIDELWKVIGSKYLQYIGKSTKLWNSVCGNPI